MIIPGSDKSSLLFTGDYLDLSNQINLTTTTLMEENTFVRPEQLAGATTTDTLLMIRPANFGSNPETAVDNAFQVAANPWELDSIGDRARVEFDHFVNKLREAGIRVLVIEDSPEPLKTDAVFPNNWITTHEDGLIVTYPMFSAIRRSERRPEIIDRLSEEFRVGRYVTLEAWENMPDRMLEGTGSMILDRKNRIAYACLSQRTEKESVEEWAQMMRFRAFTFLAVDAQKIPIYHTNVMMALGTTHAVVCLESVYSAEEKLQLERLLKSTGKEIVDISLEQMNHFAGNMLELKGEHGPVWAMSTTAYSALREDQLKELQKNGSTIVHSELTTLETYGGGSARCMMAEIFLPPKK